MDLVEKKINLFDNRALKFFKDAKPGEVNPYYAYHTVNKHMRKSKLKFDTCASWKLEKGKSYVLFNVNGIKSLINKLVCLDKKFQNQPAKLVFIFENSSFCDKQKLLIDLLKLKTLPAKAIFELEFQKVLSKESVDNLIVALKQTGYKKERESLMQ